MHCHKSGLILTWTMYVAQDVKTHKEQDVAQVVQCPRVKVSIILTILHNGCIADWAISSGPQLVHQT